MTTHNGILSALWRGGGGWGGGGTGGGNRYGYIDGYTASINVREIRYGISNREDWSWIS